MQLFGMTSIAYRIGLTTINIEMTKPFLYLFFLLHALDCCFLYMCVRAFCMCVSLFEFNEDRNFNVVSFMNCGENCCRTTRKTKWKSFHSTRLFGCNSHLKEMESSVNRQWIVHFNFLLHGVPPKMWFILCIIKSIQHIKTRIQLIAKFLFSYIWYVFAHT